MLLLPMITEGYYLPFTLHKWIRIAVVLEILTAGNKWCTIPSFNFLYKFSCFWFVPAICHICSTGFGKSTSDQTEKSLWEYCFGISLLSTSKNLLQNPLFHHPLFLCFESFLVHRCFLFVSQCIVFILWHLLQPNPLCLLILLFNPFFFFLKDVRK